ncbi:helix-turn-helix domain-containing protein [Frondihabitans sp. 4ASC-45]|uniref:winged helix-turn-helix transcriptional regulator n=1 Tax=Frondihabitans sp. 4ASC-45 TaxID=3111636 RepID=UPI003C1CD19F
MDVSFAVNRERPGFAGGKYPADCSSRIVLNHITSRWGVLVLLALERGTLRWGELRREVEGISEKMLASTLKTFEADGILHREAQPTVPPRVDYTLTERGREVAMRLMPLMDWIADNADDIVGER